VLHERIVDDGDEEVDHEEGAEEDLLRLYG